MKLKLLNFILPVRLWRNLNLHLHLHRYHFLLPGTRTIRWARILFLLLSLPIHAQVVIKERVEVEPQVIHSYSPATNSHTVRFEISWEALVVPENNHFYNANLYVKTEAKDNCENTVGINDWTYGWPSGSQVININNANAYAYDLTIGINGFYDAYQFVDITMRVYVDNVLDRNESWQIMGNVPTHYEYRRCWVWITNKFNFRIQYPDLDFMGSITDMSYNPDYDCSSNPGASLVKDILNLTILNGTEFVSFYDSRTEETVYGNISVHFNELSDIDLQYDRPLYGTEDKYIVIEAESNGIVEKDSVKIKPLDYQLEVILEPDTLAPGETATVTVKKRNNDGTITDFDAGQTFEVGMLDGCVLGNIFVGSDSAKYFYDIPQPITFKADANAEAGVVKLRVGLIEQIGGISKGLRGTGNELTTEKGEARTLNFNRLKKPTTTSQPPTSPENTENYCPGVIPTQRIYKDANVVVGGCDYPPYDPNSYVLNYQLIRHDNYYPTIVDDEAQFPITLLVDVCDDPNDPDLKQAGGSKPVYYSKLRSSGYINSWDIKPLIDGEDQLHFSIVDPLTMENTTLKFDFVTGVCYFKINHPSHTPKTLIYNLTDLSDRQIIPNKNEALIAMQDFCGHHCYPQQVSKYLLIDIINLHELEHMNDYRDSCIIPNFQQLVEEIKKVTLACKFYDSQAKVNQIKLINYFINNFIKGAIEHFNKINELATKGDFIYEKRLQEGDNVVRKIKEYIDKLETEFKITKPSNCTVCP